jgi:hypothetical protein
LIERGSLGVIGALAKEKECPMGSHERLELGKSKSFFVKAQLRRLSQEDETWEADFFPIPCSDAEHDSVWWGIVLSHAHENVLAPFNVAS